MATLSGSSTLAEVESAYDDNASYAEDLSVAKAKAFITAVRILIRRLPAEAGTREGNLRLSPELLASQLKEAQAYVAANDTSTAAMNSNGPPVTRGSFRYFRD